MKSQPDFRCLQNREHSTVPETTVAERKSGDVLYAVDGVPVRIVEGAVPFYRALSEGVSGPDVAQLEKALVALGHLGSADATYDAATTQAVTAWQRALGSAATGSVGVGELVAAPALPASVAVDTKVAWTGAMLSGGEVIVSMGTGDPVFTLPLSPGQVNLVPPDAAMTVEGFGKSWPALWASSEQDPDLGVGQVVTLSSPDGGAVCADACDVVPAEQSWVTVHIEVVPRTTGPAVPVSAVTTDASGQAWVTVVDGENREQRKVSVQRSHAGLAVLDGVEVGETVQALATDDAQPGAPIGSEPAPRRPRARHHDGGADRHRAQLHLPRRPRRSAHRHQRELPCWRDGGAHRPERPREIDPPVPPRPTPHPERRGGQHQRGPHLGSA